MTMDQVIWSGPMFMSIAAMGIYILAKKHLSVNADLNDAKLVQMADFFKSKRFLYLNQRGCAVLFLIGLCAYLYANYSGLCTVPQEDFCKDIESVIGMAVAFVVGTWAGALIFILAYAEWQTKEEKA